MIVSLGVQTNSVARNSSACDSDFVTRIAAGDEIAFEKLMRQNNRMLYRTARAILRDDADAEDALQRAYLKIYRSIRNFRGQAKLSTWMTRIVANESMMQLRRRRGDENVITFETLSTASDNLAAPRDGSEDRHSPEAEVLRAQMRALVEQKIDALPDAFRTVFMLRAVEELSVETTATALGIPEATVRTRFFRARGLLRESLDAEIDGAIEDAFSFDGPRCDRIVASVLEQLKQPFT